MPPGSATVVVPVTGTVDLDFVLGTSPLQFQLTLDTDGNGAVTQPWEGTDYVNYDEDVQITAEPDTGYAFDYWQVLSGTASIADEDAASTTVTLSGDATIRAVFYQTTAGASISGTISTSSPLILWWYNEQTYMEDWDVYTSGTFPFDYTISTISGLEDGNYEVGAILDTDGDSEISAGDLYGEYPSVVTISGSSQMDIDFELAELGSEDGTITVVVYNAAAENGHDAYFAVVASGGNPETDPYLGQGAFPIASGYGEGVAMDATGMTEVVFPPGILQDVYIFIDTDDGGEGYPEYGEPMSDWIDVYIDGDIEVDFDYSVDFYPF